MTTTNGGKHFGTPQFCREARCTPVQMRIMEGLGVIHPLRNTPSGWRMFTAADVAAAREWKLAQKARA